MAAVRAVRVGLVALLLLAVACQALRPVGPETVKTSRVFSKFAQRERERQATRKSSVRSWTEATQRIQPVTDQVENVAVTNRVAQNSNATSTRARRDACPSPVQAMPPSTSPHEFKETGGGLQIVWAGAPIKEMLVIADSPLPGQTNMHVSFDYGNNFVPADVNNAPIIDAFYSSRLLDNDHILAFAIPSNVSAKGLYMSKGNNNWVFVSTVVHFDAIYPHPENANIFAAAQDVLLEDRYARRVFVCRDAGSALVAGTITCVQSLKDTDYVLDIAWGTRAPYPLLLTRIKQTLYHNDYVDYALDFIRIASPVDGGRAVVARSNCDHFLQMDRFIFVTEVPDDSGFNERALHVSSDGGLSFLEATFPNNGKENNYHIVDASEDEVLAVVRHRQTRFEGTAVFQVDGRNFTAFRALFSDVLTPEWTSEAGLFYDPATDLGCSAQGGVPAAAAGKIVLLRRGQCTFAEKARNAEVAGAAAVVIGNTNNSFVYMAAPDDVERPDIPTLMVILNDFNTIRSIVVTKAATGRMTESNVQEVALWSTTTLYISDASGTQFSVALKDIVAQPAMDPDAPNLEYVDVFKINLPGTYIANVRVAGVTKSVITYNKGSHWWPVDAPAGCHNLNECYLHLALEGAAYDMQVPLPQTSPNAYGIIIANGWRGIAAPSDIKGIATYASFDGGASWQHVAEGMNNYRILDHGGVIVLVPVQSSAANFTYTLDQGVTFLTAPFADVAVRVAGLVTEPGSHTATFFLYYLSRLSNKWVGIRGDFSRCFRTGQCQAEDYEDWSPRPETHLTCTLGETYIVRRRKPCSSCYNGLNHEAETQTRTPCPCGEQDFKCRPGYFRANILTNPAAPCLRDFDMALPCAGSDLKVPYERVPDDQCTDSPVSKRLLTPVTVLCDAEDDDSGESTQVKAARGFGIFVAVIVILLIGVALLFLLSSRARSKAIQLLGVEEGLAGAVGRFLARFSCFRRGQQTVQYSQLATTDHEQDDDELLFGLGDGAGAAGDADADADADDTELVFEKKKPVGSKP